jgi:hypothetical protein
MKYYKIKIRLFYPNERISSTAVGDKIPNIEFCLERMKSGEIIEEVPLLDYFYLESYDKKKYWEWRLFDVHDLRGKGIHVPCWFVSGDLKLLLENFNLTKPHHFYPSKLLYKGSKRDYYIFQFDGNSISDEVGIKYIEWSKSLFQNPIDKKYLSINSLQEFIDKYRSIARLSKYDKSIVSNKVVLNQAFDLFPLHVDPSSAYIVSSRLKEAIETMGITGFEFSELDYEVVVDNE